MTSIIHLFSVLEHLPHYIAANPKLNAHSAELVIHPAAVAQSVMFARYDQANKEFSEVEFLNLGGRNRKRCSGITHFDSARRKMTCANIVEGKENPIHPLKFIIVLFVVSIGLHSTPPQSKIDLAFFHKLFLGLITFCEKNFI
jgi:hypothetical protein